MRYLPVFVAIFGVALLFMSMFFGNTTMFFLSIIIFSVLPPILEEVGRSLKEKYGATQNEIDVITMILKIPDWSLGYEMLSSIAITVVSAVLKNFVVCYLGLWLLFLGGSLSTAQEINGLKEDLRSPDLERRRAAMEKVESNKQIITMATLSLFGIGVFILFYATSGSFALVKDAIMIVLIFTSLIPAYIVFKQADKVMPPEPGKADSAAS